MYSPSSGSSVYVPLATRARHDYGNVRILECDGTKHYQGRVPGEEFRSSWMRAEKNKIRTLSGLENSSSIIDLYLTLLILLKSTS